MRLHEYQSKKRFAAFGIPVPPGHIVQTADEVTIVATELNTPVIIKSQVLAGSRERAGGIRQAHTPEEAYRLAIDIMDTPVQGLTARKLLIEPIIRIQQELYLAITNDRSSNKPVLIASSMGGIDIDHVAQETPEAIMMEYIDPIMGLHAYQVTRIASDMNLPRHLWRGFTEITRSLYECYMQSDAYLAEINPLAITDDETFVAIDGKLQIDDNALYRHYDLAELRDVEGELEAERIARDAGISYKKLDGQIGCLVNGAGLAMTIMDMIYAFGDESIGPANFLDIGGGARAEKAAAAFHIILADPAVSVILLNIFGGITRCDEIARAFIKVCDNLKPDLPVIARFQGTNAEQGRQILETASIRHLVRATSLHELIDLAVAAAKET